MNYTSVMKACGLLSHETGENYKKLTQRSKVSGNGPEGNEKTFTHENLPELRRTEIRLSLPPSLFSFQ